MAEKATLLLFDVWGRHLVTKPVMLVKGNNQVMIEGLGKLAAGTYFLHVISGTKKYVHKFMKQTN